MKYSDLLGEVGFFLGFGRGAGFGDQAWTSRQQTTLDYVVKGGLRQFYYPPPVAGERTGYDWSFLKPTVDFTLQQGHREVQLPDDYGGLEGQVTVVATAQTTQPWYIEWENEGRVRQRYSTVPSMIGAPMFVAEQWSKTGPTALGSQKAHLLFFPQADQDYQLQLPYYVNPNYITTQAPYCYGGAQHSETILESCLAIAEQRLDDMSGVHGAKFNERLAASIAMDRKSKPLRLGYNADRSDRPDYDRSIIHWWAGPATYAGQGFD